MATVVDSLLITMGLDGAGVTKGMNQVENRLSSGVKNIVTNILAPLAGAFAFQQLFSSFVHEADALGDLSEAINVSVKDLDSWGQAAQYAGGTVEGFQGSITALSGSLAQLSTTGGGRAKKFFQALGINAEDSKGKVKPAIDVLLDLSSKFEHMSKQESFGLGQKLGLDQGTITLLQKGRGEVERIIKEMKELSYSEEDAKIAGDFDDNINKLTKSLKLLTATFFSFLGPGLNFVIEKMKDGVQYLRKHEAFVITFFGSLAAVILGKTVPAIWAMTAALLKNPITWIIAGLLALSLVLEDLWVYINGGESALEGLWSKFGEGKDLLQWVQAEGKNLIAVLEKYGPALAIVTAGIKGVTIAMRLMGIASLSNPVLLLITALATAATYIIANWDGIVSFFEGVFDSIASTISEWVDTVIGLLPDWLKEMLGIDGGDGLTVKARVQIDEAPQKQYGAKYAGGEAFAAYRARDGINPALAAGPVDNSTQTTFNQTLTVYPKSDDAKGIARETSAEMRRLTNTANNGGGH